MSKKTMGALATAAAVCVAETLLVGDLSAFLVLAIAAAGSFCVFVLPLAVFVYMIAKGWRNTRPPML